MKKVPCPKCGSLARVVWVSEDGHTVAVKCLQHRHRHLVSEDKRFSEHSVEVEREGMVFLVNR